MNDIQIRQVLVVADVRSFKINSCEYYIQTTEAKNCKTSSKDQNRNGKGIDGSTTVEQFHVWNFKFPQPKLDRFLHENI